MNWSGLMTFSLEESYAWCKSLSRRTAGNFYFSFLTLPAEKFRDMCVLYAFMRVSDDLGDDDRVPIPRRVEQLAGWRASLERALSRSRFDHVVFPALVEMIGRNQVPHEYLFTVIDGVDTDLNPNPNGFETFDELSDYCYRVAGAVGLCCIHVWGFHDERALESAVDCGLAFQLTNILRDLGEDADRGRVYLPREDLRRFGYTTEDITGRKRDERLVQLMQFEVERTKTYYSRAEKLFEYLEPPGKPIYAAMLKIYGGLLAEIERRNYDVFSQRVKLPAWRKLLISLHAIVRHRLPAKRG